MLKSYLGTSEEPANHLLVSRYVSNCRYRCYIAVYRLYPIHYTDLGAATWQRDRAEEPSLLITVSSCPLNRTQIEWTRNCATTSKKMGVKEMEAKT